MAATRRPSTSYVLASLRALHVDLLLAGGKTGNDRGRAICAQASIGWGQDSPNMNPLHGGGATARRQVGPIVTRRATGRVLAGLPGQLAGAGFTLPGAGQLSLGSTNRGRGLLPGLIAFRPRHLSDPGGFGGLPVSAGRGGFRISAGTGDLLSQLAAGLGGLLASTASLGAGGLPAA